MFSVKEIKVINTIDQIRVLEANPVAASVPVIGEGTSFDDFDGFTATNFVQIVPFSQPFSLSQLRSIRRTTVKADNLPYPTPASLHYSATTNGSQHNPASNRFATTTEVRRASAQTSTITVNALPLVGSEVMVTISFRDLDRSGIESQYGSVNVLVQLIVRTGDTLNSFTQRLRDTIAQAFQSHYNYNRKLVSSVAANVITLSGQKTGLEFKVYSGETDIISHTALDITENITIPSFVGVNDFNWLRKYIKTNEGMYELNMGETDFMPTAGQYYTSYFIKFDQPSTQEHQSGSINVVQNHLIEYDLYVNSALTSVITKLDLIGGF